jgi:hypothetical protein
MSDFLQSRIKKATQARTDDAYWNERSQFQSPEHRDAFEKWFDKEYGGALDVGYYRTGRRNDKLRMPTSEEYYTAKNQFDYDRKGLYPDLKYDPFRRDKLENEAWKTYLKTRGYQNFDKTEFERTYNRLKYKDQYDMSIAEDAQAYETGDKPYRYQMSEKAANEYKQLLSDIDNGTLGQSWREKYKTLAAYDAYALNAAKEAAAAKAKEDKRRQDALDNGETYTEPFTSPLTGTKKAKASPLDLDTLKELGWDENAGFSWIDQAIIGRQQAINDRAAAAKAPAAMPTPQNEPKFGQPGMPNFRQLESATNNALDRPVSFREAEDAANAGIAQTQTPTGPNGSETREQRIERYRREAMGVWGGRAPDWIPDWLIEAAGAANEYVTPNLPQNLAQTYAIDTASTGLKNAYDAARNVVKGEPMRWHGNLTASGWKNAPTVPQWVIEDAQKAMAENHTDSKAYQDAKWAVDLASSPVGGAILGVIGDALFDPTTYVGAAEVAQIVKFVKAGKLDDAAKLAQKLSRAEKAVGGIRGKGLPASDQLPRAATPAARALEQAPSPRSPSPAAVADDVWKLRRDTRTGELLSESTDGRFTIRAANGKFKLYEVADDSGKTTVAPRGEFYNLDDAKAAAMPETVHTAPRVARAATIDSGPTIGKNTAMTPRELVRPAAEPRNVAAVADDISDATLTQKIPPAGGTNPTLGPTQRFETSKPRMTFRETLNRKIRETLDPQQGVKNIGDNQRVYRSAINSKNVSTQIGNIMERELVGMDGKRVGDSLKKMLLDNVPEGKELEFWEYALQKHNVARANAGKPIFSQLVNGKEVYFSAAESAARVKQLEALHPEWASKAKNITKWLDTFMQEWGVKAGTVDAQAYKDLRLLYEDYLPTNRAFSDLEDFIPESGAGRGFIDKSSPIKTATGSQRNIIDPSENIINLVNRTVRTARLNEVGQVFVDVIKANPQKMKALAEIVPRDVANVDNVMQVLVKGKPVFVKINDLGVMDTLTKLSEIKELSKLGQAVGKVTGFMKSAITTNNPLFGVLNGFRDVQTYMTLTQARPVRAIGNYVKAGAEVVASDVINPTLRKLGATKAGQTLGIKPFVTKQLDQFRGLGGEGSTLTGPGTYKTAEKLLGKKAVTNAAGEITGFKKANPAVRLGRWLGKEAQKFNTAIEITPRYAEFKNAIAKGKTLEQALYDAAEITTNFSRGGATMKEADQFVLYLNASVQGLARLGRALNPLRPKQFVSTLLKGGIAITLPQAVLTEFNKNNPYYREVDNRIKDAYFLVPNPTDRDESGVPKTFIRIPRSREFGYLLGAFYDRVYRAASGDKGAWKGTQESLATTFAPADPLKNNVIAPLANVAANRDVFGRNIVPRALESRSPHLQYDEKTTEPAKWIAQALYDMSDGKIDVSPKVMDYLADSYLGIISDIGMPATTAQTYQGGKALESLGKIVTRRFTADPLYSNQTITDFYDEIDKFETAASDRNFKEGVESGASTPEERKRSTLTKAAQEISKLSKEAAQSDDPAAIRRQMIQIAKDALAAVEGMKNTRVYPAGVDDQKRDAYDKIVDGGISEDKMRDIFKKFTALEPKPGNKTVTVADRKNALWRMVKDGALTEKQYGAFVRFYYPKD